MITFFPNKGKAESNNGKNFIIDFKNVPQDARIIVNDDEKWWYETEPFDGRRKISKELENHLKSELKKEILDDDIKDRENGDI